jgi:hypothetical protein
VCEKFPAEDARFERLITTLSVLALTLADFRERIEALEDTRWSRFRAWFARNVYSTGPIFTHTPHDRRNL